MSNLVKLKIVQNCEYRFKEYAQDTFVEEEPAIARVLLQFRYAEEAELDENKSETAKAENLDADLIKDEKEFESKTDLLETDKLKPKQRNKKASDE